MTDNGYSMSTRREKNSLHIQIGGTIALNSLNNLRDTLIQKIEGYQKVVVTLSQKEELHFSVLQLLVAVQNIPDSEVSVILEIDESLRPLMVNTGLARLINIK